MTSIIKLYCLSGGQDGTPPCYLLQIDQFKCLLDCGWDEKFSESIVDEISKHFRSLDAILLSYPDHTHLGALPYLVKKFGLPCPIYATRPVTLMGRMFMTDIVLSKLNNQEFDLFTLDDVKKTFDNEKIKHLDYNSTFHLEKGSGLSITPLAAGHMLGGTIWKIVKDDEEEIIYAVDYNHKKERHLNGCEQTLKLINKPSLLITDAFNAMNHQGKKRERDQKFCTTILDTLRGGGNVLIPCDTAGRVLEIALMLDHIWSKKESGLSAYSLALVSNVAVKMISLASSTVVWMSDDIYQDTNTRDKAFKFKHLQLKHKIIELGYLPQPICVLATMADLEFGFARDLFTLWVSNPNYSIIFTQRPGPSTLGHQVLNTTAPTIDLDIYQRIELEGVELEEYYKREEEKKQQALIESQRALNIHDSDTDDDEFNDMEVDSLETVHKLDGKSKSKSKLLHKPSKHDLMMTDASEKATMFFKQARKTYTMYPAPAERKIKVDAYGEEINPQDYILFYKMQGTNKLLEVEENKENTSTAPEALAEEEKEPEVKPTKCLKITAKIPIQARLHSFDFEGRSDGLSIKNLITQMEPRRMILVGGSPESTAYLAEKCRPYVNEKIFKPNTGDIVDATTENYIYQVKLKDSLVTSLDFLKTDSGVELAWVDAKTQLMEQDELESEKLPLLDAGDAESIPSHNAIFINELKLSDFKQVLLNNNIQAEFSDGILYCGDKLAVKKRETGRIHLEGILCDEYFKVRDLLYKQYVIM